MLLFMSQIHQDFQALWVVLVSKEKAHCLAWGNPRHRDGARRLPNLEHVLINPQTQWSKAALSNWYGEIERPVEITTEVSVWYHTGLPVVPIRWVIVRDPFG